jgi:hypothetical protein
MLFYGESELIFISHADIVDGRPDELTAKQSALKCGDTMKYKARYEVPTAVLKMFQVFKAVTLEPEDGYTTLLRQVGKYLPVDAA